MGKREQIREEIERQIEQAWEDIGLSFDDIERLRSIAGGKRQMLAAFNRKCDTFSDGVLDAWLLMIGGEDEPPAKVMQLIRTEPDPAA